jgi:hypothetical protein
LRFFLNENLWTTSTLMVSLVSILLTTWRVVGWRRGVQSGRPKYRDWLSQGPKGDRPSTCGLLAPRAGAGPLPEQFCLEDTPAQPPQRTRGQTYQNRTCSWISVGH